MIWLILILILLAGCSSSGLVGKTPLPDGTQQVNTRAATGVPGFGRVTVLYLWQHDPKTNKTTFIRGDAAGQINLPSLPNLPVPIP